MKTDRKINNLAFLNPLRLILALSVTFWHMVGCQYGFNASEYKVIKFIYNMTLFGGVPTFFLISGMLFYLCYLQKLSDKTISAKSFLINRVIRIYPLAIITILFDFFVAVSRSILIEGETFSFGELLIDLVFFGNTGLTNSFGSYNGATWYLFGLMACYLISLLIVLLYRKKKTVLWFLIPLFFGFYGVHSSLPSIPILTNPIFCIALFNFFEGVLFMPVLQLFFSMKNRILKTTIRVIALMFSLFMIYFVVKKDYDMTWFGNANIVFNLLIWMPLFLSLYGLKLNIIFDNKVFGFLSEWSFSIYLWHIPLNSLFTLIVLKNSLSGDKFHIFYIYYACLAVLTILSTIGIHKLTKFLKNKYQQYEKKKSEQIEAITAGQ